MRPPVHNIQHGYRKAHGASPAEIPIKRKVACHCCASCHGQRDTQNCIGPQLVLVWRPVQVNERLINDCLLAGIKTFQGVVNNTVYISYCFKYPLAAKPLFIAVSQFQGLSCPG